MERCFNPEEARIILCMPLSHFGCSDRLNWHYTQDGIYSVKSGYLVAQEMNMNGELGRRGQSSCDATKDTIWMAVWWLRVPPKLRHFIWKGCKCPSSGFD